jgi:integrase
VGEGSVFRRKDGKWCAKWKDASGKWRYLYRKSKAEAKQALREALKDRDDNIIPADKLTLSHALDQWLENMEGTVSKRTYVNRESLVRIHIKPHVGSVRLCKLTGEHLRVFYREKLHTLSPATVARLHDVIKKACNEQVRARTLRHNPTAGVTPPRTHHSRDMTILTQQQVKLLLETVRGSRYEVIIVLGATCALRVGEALSLRWEDVDLTAGTLSIRHTLWRGKLYAPKTAESRRTLKLPQRALDCLLSVSNEASEGYLLSTCNGTPVAAENFWRWGWKPALRKAGLDESLHYHDLRHGAASLLLNQSVPLPVVSKFLGHADPSVTMRIYAHVMDGTSGIAAQGIDSALR